MLCQFLSDTNIATFSVLQPGYTQRRKIIFDEFSLFLTREIMSHPTWYLDSLLSFSGENDASGIEILLDIMDVGAADKLLRKQ